MSTTQNMSARERIDFLLDDNSFVEIGGAVKARSTDFNLLSDAKENDGVITGFGLIGGKLCYVYSQDSSVLGGSIGEMHTRKIVGLYAKAISMGAPIIGLIDSTGVRVKESADAIHALAKIYKCMAKASGVIPQFTGVFGNCGGGLAVLTAMSDFTYAVTGTKLYVNTPNSFAGNYTEKLDTADVSYQATETDNIDFVGSSEEVLSGLRNLVDILPENNEEEIFTECTDDLNRKVSGIENGIKDITIALSMISDNGEVVALKEKYAPSMVTAFIKLNGATIGVVANRSASYDEEGNVVDEYEDKLTSEGCVKAADFVNFCNTFNIPVLSITNVTGYVATEYNEKKIAKASAKLAYAFAYATVAKVNLIVGEAYGSALAIMNSKGLGADMVYAWPDAQVGAMKSLDAAKIVAVDGDVNAAKDKFDELNNSVSAASSRGYVDTIINPEDTRKYLIGAFEMLYSKVDTNPDKKNGTI